MHLHRHTLDLGSQNLTVEQGNPGFVRQQYYPLVHSATIMCKQNH